MDLKTDVKQYSQHWNCKAMARRENGNCKKVAVRGTWHRNDKCCLA